MPFREKCSREDLFYDATDCIGQLVAAAFIPKAEAFFWRAPSP